MLFDASNAYAAGQARGDVAGGSGYQNVNLLGRYHLELVKPYSALIGLGGLALVAWLVHRSGRRR